MDRWLHAVIIGTSICCFSAVASEPTCDLGPVEFPGNSFLKLLESYAPTSLAEPDLPFSNAILSFSAPRPDAAFPKPVVDVSIRMNLVATKIPQQWKEELERAINDSGCSIQSTWGYNMSPRSDGSLGGYFHIKYVNRWCWGPATGDNFTVETDVWHDFRFSIPPDGSTVTLSVSGKASNNVSQFVREAAKVAGNVLSLIPLTSHFVLGLDSKIFSALKAERDAMEMLQASRVLKPKDLGGLSTVVCPKHGPWKVLPLFHLQGSGCLQCSREKNRLGNAQFIKRAQLVHGAKRYLYDLVEYRSSRAAVKIICPREGHGEFLQAPASHLRGAGCPLCAVEAIKTSQRASRDEILARAVDVHGGRYDYSKVNYINIDTRVLIHCRLHGPFYQTPYQHIQNKCGCPECGLLNARLRREP